MKFSKLASFVISAVALFASCDTVDTFDWEGKYFGTPDQAYERDFKSMFTKVSDAITWSTLKVDSVTVTALTPDESLKVQVFTADPRGSRKDCFLMYEGTIASGKAATLKFDSPIGLDYVYVGLVQSDGARAVVPIEVGGARTVRVKPSHSYMSSGITLVKPSTTDYSYPFYSTYYNHYADTYSDYRNYFNRSNGLVTSFEYLATGSDIYVIPFGNSRESNRTLYYYVYNPSGTTLEAVRASIANGTIQGNALYASSDAVVTAAASTTIPYKTKPYIIRNVSLGYHILFYTVSSTGYMATTNAQYNGGSIEVGAMDINGHTIVRFDETGSNASLNGTRTLGYNDFAFGLSGGMLIDYEDATSSYTEYGMTLAFEAAKDTSATDMDFNDAVVRVHRVAGTTEVHAVPVAVGDTGCMINFVALGGAVQELHALLGADLHTMVNTTSITVTSFDTTTVVVDPSFLLSEHLQDFQFQLIVDGKTRYYSLPASGGAVTNVFAIATPRWDWPLEGTPITDPYSSITRWAASPANYAEWYTSTWSRLNSWTESLSFYNEDSQL